MSTSISGLVMTSFPVSSAVDLFPAVVRRSCGNSLEENCRRRQASWIAPRKRLLFLLSHNQRRRTDRQTNIPSDEHAHRIDSRLRPAIVSVTLFDITDCDRIHGFVERGLRRRRFSVDLTNMRY